MDRPKFRMFPDHHVPITFFIPVSTFHTDRKPGEVNTKTVIHYFTIVIHNSHKKKKTILILTMKKKITFSLLFLSLEFLVSFLHPTTARGGDRSSNATSGILFLLFRFHSVAFSLCSFHVFRFSMRNDLILIASITYLKLDQNVL